MNEKLIIRNFATIKEADIDVGPINVLIGPQSTGKSICAKSLYYFKRFSHDLFTSVEQNLTKPEFDRAFLKKFEEYFPLQSLGTSNFFLRYEVGNTYIQVERTESNKPKLEYSEFYAKELAILRKQFDKNIKKYAIKQEDARFSSYRAVQDTRMAFYDNFKNELGIHAVYGQLFIPAGRSFFSILQSSIFSFLSSNNAVDPFLTEFGSFYENMKNFPFENLLQRDKTNELKILKEKIDLIIKNILGGEHMREKGKDYFVYKDGRQTSLANSSSGQQEMLPLAIILSVIPFVPFLGGNGNSIYIEEPEAHLFPTAQKKIVELVATIFNLSKIPTQFFITTHSPYVLASFNNLIHAGNLSTTIAETEKEKLKKIVPEDQWIKSDDINVYSVADGKFESIKSKETGLISTNILDYVSNEIGQQFDSLLDIEE